MTRAPAPLLRGGWLVTALIALVVPLAAARGGLPPGLRGSSGGIASLPREQVAVVDGVGDLPVSLTPESSGRWVRLGDDRWSWRLRLQAAGVRSLAVELGRYRLPAGARIWVYDPAAVDVHGPFTRADRGPGGRFVSPPVRGEELIVELVVPNGASGRAAVAVTRVVEGPAARSPRGVRWAPAPVPVPAAEVGTGRQDEPGPCRLDVNTLCLLDGRYEVRLTWFNQFDGRSGVGGARAFTDFSGFFWFDDPANLEILLKILELDGAIKVFYGQLTNLQFELTVRETATGRVKTYANGPEDCGAIDQDFQGLLGGVVSVERDGDAPPGLNACVPTPARLCLLDGRFEVVVDWRNQFNGQRGIGLQQQLSRLSGLFHYGDPRNVELLVKVLEFPDRFLFIWGALSDLEHTITVTDTTSGAAKQYANPAGRYCGGLDNDFAAGGEQEPNNRPEQAQRIESPSPRTLPGTAEVADVGDVEILFDLGLTDDVEDLYVVTTTGPGLRVELDGLRSDCDIYVLDEAITEILNPDDQGTTPGVLDERVELPQLPPGTYYVGVSIYDPDPDGPSSTSYRLTVAGGF